MMTATACSKIGANGHRPIGWSGAVPTAIFDRFLHHSEVLQITGKSDRLHHAGSTATDPAQPAASKTAKLPTGSDEKSRRCQRSKKTPQRQSAATK